MSRFADPQATKRMELGPCECTGSPHAEGDWIAMRCELGADDLVYLEEHEGYERMKFLAKGWNLLGDDGNIAPLDDAYFGRLYLDMFPRINEWLTENARTTALPKAPVAASPPSLQERRSRTPRALKAG